MERIHITIWPANCIVVTRRKLWISLFFLFFIIHVNHQKRSFIYSSFGNTDAGLNQRITLSGNRLTKTKFLISLFFFISPNKKNNLESIFFFVQTWVMILGKRIYLRSPRMILVRNIDLICHYMKKHLSFVYILFIEIYFAKE